MAQSLAAFHVSPSVVATSQSASLSRPPAFVGLRAASHLPVDLSKACRASSSASSALSRSNARARKSVVCEATETATAVGSVTDNTFKSLVLDSDVPVLVDFWAPWCGPCRMIEPLMNELAALYGPKLRVLKLNTDESPGIATEFGIRSIPTVMLFKKGKKVDTVIGAVPKNTFISTIDKYL